MWFTHQSNLVYATTVLEKVEYSYSVFESKGWQMPPPDCDESISDINNPQHCMNFGGNSLYDVYIGVVEGPAAAVVPENPYVEIPYLGAITSYMLFGNSLGAYGSNDDLLPFNDYIAAHEIHHAIQFSYGSYVTGPPGNQLLQSWMLEQTATYVQNVVFPNSLHLKIILGNCDANTPLTYPESGIYMPYSGALWQKYLVETLQDSTIIKQIWESYGTQISDTNDPVSFFSIFNEVISESGNNDFTLEDAYKEYSIWRYFTGERAIPNQYFTDASFYCTAKTISMPTDEFQFLSNLGTTMYIDIPNEDIRVNINSDSIEYLPAILVQLDLNQNYTLTEFNLMNGENLIEADNTFNGENTLIITSGYTGIEFENVIISMESITDNYIGDINNDGVLNIIDVVLLVNFILLIENPSEIEFITSDVNNDGILNVLDIVEVIDIILSH